jgi:hypothetical protein
MQEKNCSEFRTGKFVYQVQDGQIDILRTESSQHEINPTTGVEIHSKVEWTSDCEYILTYEEVLNHSEDVSSIIGTKIYVEILATDGNKFRARAKSDAMDEEFEFLKIN